MWETYCLKNLNSEFLIEVLFDLLMINICNRCAKCHEIFYKGWRYWDTRGFKEVGQRWVLATKGGFYELPEVAKMILVIEFKFFHYVMSLVLTRYELNVFGIQVAVL